MFEIRKLSVGAFARVCTTIAVLFYLITGALVTLLYAGVRTLVANTFNTTIVGATTLLLGWLAGTIVVLIVVYIISAIVAALYNLFAKWWGGFTITLVKTHSEMQEHTQAPVAKKTAKPKKKSAPKPAPKQDVEPEPEEEPEAEAIPEETEEESVDEVPAEREETSATEEEHTEPESEN